MRQLIIGIAIGFVVNVFFPWFWEHVMTSAPDWLSRAVMVAGTCLSVVLVLSAEPVRLKLVAPRDFPISSTLIVLTASLIICVTTWERVQ